MSLFSGAQGVGTAGLVVYNDDRARPPQFVFTPENAAPGKALAPWTDASLWPRSRFSGSDMSMGMLTENSGTTSRWACMPDPGGASSYFFIRGTSRDSAGVALANCIIQGFRTSDDLYVGQVVSDAAGNFALPTPYSGTAHYLVAYKAGSPDVAGTSVNTIVPT